MCHVNVIVEHDERRLGLSSAPLDMEHNNNRKDRAESTAIAPNIQHTTAYSHIHIFTYSHIHKPSEIVSSVDTSAIEIVGTPTSNKASYVVRGTL